MLIIKRVARGNDAVALVAESFNMPVSDNEAGGGRTQTIQFRTSEVSSERSSNACFECSLSGKSDLLIGP